MVNSQRDIREQEDLNQGQDQAQRIEEKEVDTEIKEERGIGIVIVNVTEIATVIAAVTVTEKEIGLGIGVIEIVGEARDLAKLITEIGAHQVNTRDTEMFHKLQQEILEMKMMSEMKEIRKVSISEAILRMVNKDSNMAKTISARKRRI